ncbi:MAG: RNA methyltransferase [Actinomycetales bacterium]|nr:RNA methyltransferase [Actinomycetales bacterium]
MSQGRDTRGAVVRVEDPSDPCLAAYTRLTDVALRQRKDVETGTYVAESSLVVRRAFEAGHRIESFLLAERWLDGLADVIDAAQRPGEPVPVYVGEPAMLETLTGFHLHRGALAIVHRPPQPSLAELVAGARRVAVLEDVTDHTNVGAVFRNAAALGIDAVLVSPRCADPLYRRAVRVSMGGVFSVPWTRATSWPGAFDELRDAGFTVAALALDEHAVTLDELAADAPERLALLLGTEGAGLTREAIEAADTVVRIPMARDVDSLNVAAASAVAFWATRPAP